MSKKPVSEEEAKTDLTVASQSNLTVADDFDYGEDAGVGFENTKSSDLSVPFINLLQSNSPDVQKCQDGSIIIGMMKNTVTGEYYKRTGFNFLPVYKDEAFVEWIPRNKGGGFVKAHDPASQEVLNAINAYGGRQPKKGADNKRIPMLFGQNELVETYYVYGLMLDADGETANGFAVIAFTSTKIKPYRDWLTSMFMLKGRPPMYAIRSHIATDIQTNESGTFGNFKITPLKEDNWVKSLLPRSHTLYAEGKSFQEMVINGIARADFSQQDQSHDSGGGGGGGGGGGAAPSAGENGNRDEVPF